MSGFVVPARGEVRLVNCPALDAPLTPFRPHLARGLGVAGLTRLRDAAEARALAKAHALTARDRAQAALDAADLASDAADHAFGDALVRIGGVAVDSSPPTARVYAADPATGGFTVMARPDLATEDPGQ